MKPLDGGGWLPCKALKSNGSGCWSSPEKHDSETPLFANTAAFH
jgi:hypothetical protein